MITLLAILLLAGLVLWVLNLGQQVNRRLDAQNTADAVARAGAGWMARSLNTVAANNTAMARYTALVAVLDAMPRSVAFTLRETEAFHQRLDDQLGTGIGGTPARLADYVRGQLDDTSAAMREQIRQLRATDRLFADFDVRELTSHQRDGRLWRAMRGMDELNRAIMDNLGLTSQRAAMDAGRMNMPEADGSAAFMLPLEAGVPHERGRFLDFDRPVRMGLLPPRADDRVTSRGPWDAVFGWRDQIGRRVGARRVPGSSRSAGGSSGKGVGISSGPARGGRSVGGRWVAVAYRTFGPMQWMKRRLARFASRDLPHTRLAWYQNRMADVKIEQVFPDPLDPDYYQTDGNVVRRRYGYRPSRAIVFPGVADIVEPRWVTNFPQAAVTANNDPSGVHETAFFVTEIKSRYPVDSPQFLTPGSFQLVEAGGRVNPRIAIVRGWQDPRNWDADRTARWVWRDEWQYEVLWDNSIGIERQFEPVPGTGGEEQQPVPQPVYRVDYFVFAGINTGEQTEIRNPYAGLDRQSEQAPAPMLLRRGELPARAPQARDEHLAVLGIARRSDRPQAWPGRFRGGRPTPSMLAVAQAELFNNHSWDLWTQMWRARLEPVSRSGRWVDAFTGAAPPFLSQQTVNPVREYLRNAEELNRAMLMH